MFIFALWGVVGRGVNYPSPVGSNVTVVYPSNSQVKSLEWVCTPSILLYGAHAGPLSKVRIDKNVLVTIWCSETR